MKRTVLLVVLLLSARPAAAVVTSFDSDFEEIRDRQPMSLLSAFLGPPHPFDDANVLDHVAFHPYLGYWENEGIGGGLGLSWQTARLTGWKLGLAVVNQDVEVPTWTVAASGRREAWASGRSSLVLGAELAWQFLKEEDNQSYAFDFGSPEEVVAESLDLFHGGLRGVYSADLGVLRPILEVELIGTWHHLEGRPWDGAVPPGPGESENDSGLSLRPAFGLGVALEAPRAYLYFGLAGVAGTGMFELSVGLLL